MGAEISYPCAESIKTDCLGQTQSLGFQETIEKRQGGHVAVMDRSSCKSHCVLALCHVVFLEPHRATRSWGG